MVKHWYISGIPSSYTMLDAILYNIKLFFQINILKQLTERYHSSKVWILLHSKVKFNYTWYPSYTISKSLKLIVYRHTLEDMS